MSRTGEETPTSTLASPIPSVVTRSSDADSETSPDQIEPRIPNTDREHQPKPNEQRNTTGDQRFMNTSTNWPRFLIIKGSNPNKTILKENPFIVSKAIESIIGTPKECKPLKNAGLLLIEVDKKHHAESLLKTTRLHDIPVEVTPHRTLNSSKGVIYCDNLDGYSNEEVLAGLKQHGENVTDVYRIQTRQQGQLRPLNLFIITFDTPTIPNKIRVAYNFCKVKLYIPNPRRCFQCQQYGHAKSHCKKNIVCANSGQEGHEYEDCENDSLCIHCKQDHACSSRACSQWQLEKKILTVKYTDNISFFEARQRVCPKPTNQPLYSQVTKKTTTADMSTQTADMSTQTPTITVTEENMDAISANNKRTRDSSEEDLPSIERLPPQKRDLGARG